MGPRPGEAERMIEEERTHWSDPGWLEQLVESAGVDEAEKQAMVNVMRYGATPGAIADLERLNLSIDVRPALPTIRVPTLVVHQASDPWVDPAHGRFLAEHIAGARYLELPASGHLIRSEHVDRFVSEVSSFFEAAREGAWEVEPDRVLATVLFTDIVGSTAKAAELGDRVWRQLLEQHHSRIRGQLSRFRGLELDTAGDGFFGRFDGPARAIRCAVAVQDAVRDLGLDLRAGVHTGECELVDGKVAGIAVSIGARVAAQAAAGEVLVSQTVKDLVAGSGIESDDRGATELKGVPGEWRLFAVESL